MEVWMEDPVAGGTAAQAVRYRLDDGERLNMLHPKQIIAFRGNPRGRSDRFMDWKGMYRKRKLIQAELEGPCEVLAALPYGYSLKTVLISGGSDLLFEFRHLFSYTPGIRMEHRLLKPKKMLVTRDWMKLKLSGEGEVALLTYGPVCEMTLHETEPLFVDVRSVVAMPENARLELCVYGNHLASQHMNYQWSMTGRGSVLIQAGLPNRELEEELEGDSLVRRMLREVLPFGGVFIK